MCNVPGSSYRTTSEIKFDLIAAWGYSQKERPKSGAAVPEVSVVHLEYGAVWL